MQDQLVEPARASQPGERVLDLATGTGEVAVRAARAGASVTAIDIAGPMLEKARRRAEEEGVDGRVRRSATSSTCRTRTRASTSLVSNFGLSSRPTTRTSPSELARVTRPGGRLGFTAWKPNPKLGELYRRFTEEPIEGREAYEWGREDHVEDMLGERLRARVRGRHALARGGVGRGDLEALLGVGAAGDRAAASSSTPDRREEFHQAFVELYESYRTTDGGIRAPRRYLLVLGRRK